MPYAILRFQKKKSGGVTACYAHNERKKEAYKSNPDVDASRKQENYHIIPTKQTYRREVQRLIKAAGCRTRKDSTVLVETLITASPEFMNSIPSAEQREYFSRAFVFIESKIRKDNIIAAIVHMDEKTPHMHLSFCPITLDNKLSAKSILGNQAQLSRWQTEYHEHMSSRWPELERGISSIETKRKHIPLSLFKQAEKLDKQVGEVEAAIANINALNAKKQREKALGLLAKWLPQAERFTARVKTVDEHIKALERAEAEAKKRAQDAENSTNNLVDNAVARMQGQIDSKDAELREADKYAAKLRQQIRNQETLIGKIPFKLREELIDKIKKGRGSTR